MPECCRNPFALLSWLSRNQPGVSGGVSAMRSAGLRAWGAQTGGCTIGTRRAVAEPGNSVEAESGVWSSGWGCAAIDELPQVLRE